MPSIDSLPIVPVKNPSQSGVKSSSEKGGSQDTQTFGRILGEQTATESASPQEADTIGTGQDLSDSEDAAVEQQDAIGNERSPGGNLLPLDEPADGDFFLKDEFTLSEEETLSTPTAQLAANHTPGPNQAAAMALAMHQPDFPSHQALADKFPEAFPPGRALTDVLKSQVSLPGDEAAPLITPAPEKKIGNEANSLQSLVKEGAIGNAAKDGLLGTDKDVFSFDHDYLLQQKELLQLGRGGEVSFSSDGKVVQLTSNSQFAQQLATSVGLNISMKNDTPVVAPHGGSNTLTATVGSASWTGEMAGRVSLMVNANIQQATLQLTPPDLGKLDIRISTDGDKASVFFTVDNGLAKDALEAAIPRLRQLMEQSGLQLAQTQVSHNTGGQSHSQGQSHLQQQGGSTGQSPVNGAAAPGGESQVEPGSNEGVVTWYTGSQGIDYYI
ncbi:flagellar hook-length control protein FliK [Porticoccus sp.]